MRRTNDVRLKHIYNFKPILYKYIIFIAPGSPNQCGMSLTHIDVCMHIQCYIVCCDIYARAKRV